MELTVRGKKVRVTNGGRPPDPGLPLLVFLHGAGMDRTIWALQTRYFASHGWSVLAVDFPGHGTSEGPPLRSVDDLADWTGDLIQAAGWERAAVVGHSLGGAAAVELAVREPRRITALALVGAAVEMPVNARLLLAARDDPPLAWEMMSGWMLSRGGLKGNHPTPGLWMFGTSIRTLASAPDGALHVDLLISDTHSAAESAARIDVPTLVVGGDSDRMLPRDGPRELDLLIPGSRFELIAGAGHMPMLERPDELLDVLSSFLDPLASDQAAVIPPSTGKATPVTKPASSDAR